ncbi:hemagglutinin repeat-containing protein [Dickeya fangzhongdai]|uniref:hemagglutinin repeat-containing protein n=1 Tax=Dickeya fangzhongdai TaxID=1778540 RepID=UPI002B25741E|nr:hemagglutinin repeat-containing protein [Dickeya fangzhongdai]WOY04382.1 hemagglutinin repeat-containing protein [Dickeya fangzhongdai]
MKAVKTSQRVLVWVLVWLTGLQPVLPALAAGVTVASGSTALEAAGNGVPVVNIAAPDAAGLSHNRYHDFSVDSRGLILNNGTAQLNPSQLGGLIQTNPNLQGRAAAAILNEVVSPNRSRLAGYLEVAGQAANVVVANPYGITCSGCGFLNTPRVTLTTGTPQFDAAGQLSGLDVRGGDILIDGAGLDASGSDYFALIARTASLQAGLNARDARVVLGANRVGMDGGVTAQPGDGPSPALALDTGALGGMYAHRISLVSTEQGVGVNTAGLSARQGDIRLAANGRLQVGSAIAQGDLTAQGATLALQDQQQAQGAIALSGTQGITLTGSQTRAGRDLTLASDGRIAADGGRLSAGVGDDGAVQPGYGLTLSGSALALGQAQLAGDRVSLSASGAVSQAAGGAWQAGRVLTVSGGALTLDGDAGAPTVTVSGGDVRGAGRWQATGELTLDGAGEMQWDGALLAGSGLTVSAGSLSNRGTLAGGTVRLTTPVLDNRGTVSGRQVTVQTPQLSNRGTLSADETLAVQAAARLDNGGSLLAGRGLTIQAGETANRGTVSGGTVTVTGDGLTNSGALQGREAVSLNTVGRLSQTATGSLVSGGGMTLSTGDMDTAGQLTAQGLSLSAGQWRNSGVVSLDGTLTATLDGLTNSGQLAANGDTRLTLGTLDNRGVLSVRGALTVSGADLYNAGQLSSQGALTLSGNYDGAGSLSSEGALSLRGNTLTNDGGNWQGKTIAVTGQQMDNRGTLSGGRVTLEGGPLTNSGTVTGVEALTVTLPGTLSNRGRLEGQTLSVTADQLDNSGTLLGVDALTLAITGTARNRADGQWLSSGLSRLTAGALDNQGRWQSGAIDATADTVRNAGQLLGLSALTLTTTGALTNSGTGQLLTQGAAVLNAAAAENDGGWQSGSLLLTAASLRNGGQIQSDGTLTATLDGLTNSGQLAANGDTRLTLGQLTNSGGVSVRGALTVDGRALYNGGQLASQGALTLSGNYDGAGSLSSEGALSLRGNTLTNDDGNWQGRTIAVTGQQMDNRGTLSGGRVTLEGGPLTNSGTVTGVESLTVTLPGALTNRGRLEGQTLSVTADQLDNSGTLLGVDALTLAITGTARNRADGQWLSNGAGRLTATALDNQGQWQSGAIDATADTVRNAGQLLGLSALTLTARDTLANSATGTLLTQGAAVLNAAAAENDGEWQAGSLTLTADSLRNGGQIQSDADLTVTLPDNVPPRTPLRAVRQLAQDVQAVSLPAGSLSNTGTLVSGGDSRLTGRRLDNQGTLSSGGTLWLTAGDTTNGGRLESRTLQLVGNQLSNGGTLLAEQGGELNLTGALTVGEPGRLLSNGDWQVQAGAVTSLGGWQGRNLLLTADSLTNGGTLLAANDATLTLTQGYNGGAGSRVVGNGRVTVTADTLTQLGELGGDRLQLTTGTLENGGRLVGLSQLEVTSRGQLTNTADGALLGNGTATVTAAALDNAGQIQGDALTLQAGTVDNAGRVQGTSALTLSGVSRYTGGAGSQLLSGGTATLAIDNADNAGLWQADELRVTGATLTNGGTLTGLNGLSLDTASLTNTGQLSTQGLATLRGQQFDNGGTLTALGGFDARYGDRVTNRVGSQLLSGGSGRLTTGTLLNQGLWQSDRLTLEAATLDNRGTLLGVTDGVIQLTGAYQGGADSRLLGNGAFSLTAATLDNAGQMQAQDVTLRAARLRNQGGISGAGQLNVTVDNPLENTAGATLLGGAVSLSGASVSNAGQIQGRGGLTVQSGGVLDNLGGGQLLSGGALTLTAAQLNNAGWAQGAELLLSTAQLDNGGTLQAQNGLTLHLPQWTNRGTVQAGQLDITTDGALENRGTLLGLTRLALQAASLTNADGARLYSAGDLQLRTGQLTQSGQLAALGDLRADLGNPFTLTRTLAAGGQLTLNVTGDLVQGGTLQGNGVTVSSTGTLTQQGRIVAGSGNSTLSAAAISQTESGSIQSGGPLSLLASGDITNRGFIGTAGDLLVQAGGLIDNSSLLYGGGNLQLLSAALVNRYGNILAGNSLWIQRDAAGNASDSVLNSSGTIETQRGDIRINTGTLTNQREGLTVTEGESITEAVPDWVGGERVEIPITWFKEGDLGIAEFYTGCLRGGKASGARCGDSAGYLLAPFARAAIQKVSLASKSVSVSAQGGEARINSANDALITSNVLLNDASTIYARNNIVLYGSSLNNRTYQAGDVKRYMTYIYDSVEFVYGTWSWINDFANDDQSVYVGGYNSPITKQLDLAEKFGIQNKHYSINYKPLGEPTTELINGQSYTATIQAGGAIAANFTQNISNTNLQPGSGGFIPALSTPTLAGVGAPTPVGAQADRGLGGAPGNVTTAALGGAGSVALAGQAGSLNAGYGAVTRDTPTSAGSPLTPVGIGSGLSAAAGVPVAGASLTPLSALPFGQLQAALTQGLTPLSGPSLTDYPLPTSQNGLFVADTASDSRYLIRTNPTLSRLGQVDNGLFGDLRGLLGQTPGTTVPVERSPTLTDPTQVLGSSYLLGKLNLDAEHDYRFLGDAAFDTRYISNAVLSQTGQRYLNGVGSELAQMQQLMDNAAAEKSRLNLQLGVSLTPEQVAGLSHSLVWWENITVGGQTVLAPKLYLAQADKTNLQGSRIVANSVNLGAGGDIDNRGSTVTAVEALNIAGGGTLSNREGGLLSTGGALNLVALGNLTNSSATIQGNRVTLASVNGDIVNTTTTDQWQFESKNGRERLNHTDIGQTGLISAQGGLTLQAGHDIALNGAQLSAGGPLQLAAGNDIRLTALTTVTDTVREGDGATTERRRQGLVQSTLASGGELSLSAGRDLSSTAAQLSAAGTLALSAGRDLSLLSASEEQFSSNAWTRHLDWQQTVTQQGTVLNAGGGLSLRAGQDLTLEGAQAETRGALTAQAGRDLNLLSATESRHDFFEETTVKKGFLSKTTTHTLRETAQTTEKGTLLSGGSVALTAGHDIGVQGSAVAADGDVTLTAGHDITTTASVERYRQYEDVSRKKSGVFSGGGIGFTIGSTSLRQTLDTAGTTQSQSVSTLGSTGGSVRLNAGQDVALTGTDVIAARDIDLSGRNVSVTPGHDIRRTTQTMEQKQSGLTIALSGSVGGALNSMVETVQAVSRESDSRLKTLAGVKAALSAGQGAQATRLALAQREGASAKAAAGGGEDSAQPQAVGVSISYGSQSSSSQQTRTQDTVSGSSVTAGGNLRVHATDGDITVVGSQLKAGQDLTLAATRDILLLSGANTQHTEGSNQSKGGSIGVSIGVSASGSFGLSVSASVNAAKGNLRGDGLTHTESLLEAGRTAILSSGRDTTLQGAQVDAGAITARVGRDLLVRSEQDSDRYDSKQQSVSAGVTIPIYGGGGGASFSFSRDKVHSNFDSVQEQSGLFAGSNGFDVTVGNHTQLDGGAIASTASAERNRLETGTLGFSNIDNRAEYSASHTGGGFSTSAPVGLQVLSNVGGLMLAGANQSGSSAGTTYAAVSDGTLVIRNPTGQQQDVSGLSRDTAGANSGALNPIFDKEKVESKLRQAQLLSEIGAQVLDIASAEGTINATKDANAGLAATSAEKRREKAASLAQASPDKVITQDDVTQALYQDYYHASLNASPYRTGGPVRQGIQAVTAALQGVLAGNVAQAVTGAAAPYLAEQIHKATTDAKGNTDVMANTIAHALLGAVVAESGGNSALAGAAGEAGGELAARALLEALYPGKKPDELNEDQKQLLSTLSTIAGGLAAGVAGNSGTDAVQGAQSAQVAVENNLLSAKRSQERYEKLAACNGDKACVAEVRREFGPESDEQRQRVETCSSAADCYTVEQGLKSMRAEYSQQEAALAEKARTQGVGSLSEAEQKEWIAARSALTELDSQINLSLHRAQTMGGSAEVSAEITNVMGHAAIASAAGVAGGISKATSKESVTTGQNSPIVPGGGLAAHEAAGGHLIARHVGQSDEQLATRLANDPKVRVASTFSDRAVAESAISNAIGANQSAIGSFMKSNNNQVVIKYSSPTVIGSSMTRGSTSSQPVSNVTVVIRKDPTMPDGYRIHTGYPTP